KGHSRGGRVAVAGGRDGNADHLAGEKDGRPRGRPTWGGRREEGDDWRDQIAAAGIGQEGPGDAAVRGLIDTGAGVIRRAVERVVLQERWRVCDVAADV